MTFKTLFRYIRHLGSFLFILGTTISCTSPGLSTASPSLTPTFNPPIWEMGQYHSDCLGRTIPKVGETIVFDGVLTPLETQILESDWIVLGTITEISDTCYNQDGGLYFSPENDVPSSIALPYYEIRLTVDEFLQQKLPLDTQDLVLTTVGYSPVGTSHPPARVDDHVLALFNDGAIGWRDAGTRPALLLFGEADSSLLVEQSNGTFVAIGGLPHRPMTLNEVQNLTNGQTVEKVPGCAEGGEGVFTPEDVRCYLATFDPKFVRELNDDIAVLFADPNSMAEWIGGAIIYHIPTVSTLVLDRFGDVDPTYSTFTNRTGLVALSQFTEDANVMAELKQQVQENWQTTSPNEPEIRLGVAWQDGATTVFLISIAGLDATDDRFYCASQLWTLGEENIHVEASCVEKDEDVLDNHVFFIVQEIKGDEEQPGQVALNGIASNVVTVQKAPISLETGVYQAIFQYRVQDFAFLRGETAWPVEDLSYLTTKTPSAPSLDMVEHFAQLNQTSISLLYLFWNSEPISYWPGWILDRDYLAEDETGLDCEKFKSDYPTSDGVFTVSQIWLSADGINALAFMRQECGDEEKSETYFLLRQRNGIWEVAEQWPNR